MEKSLRLKTPDNQIIYSTLNYSGKKPSSVILLVHGLPGGELDHPILAASRFFSKKGFATCRINLYDWKKRARKLRNITTRTHGNDITLMIHFLKKQFQNVFLVGHSWGWPSILLADISEATAISSWDGSMDLAYCVKDYTFSKSIQAYIGNYGVSFVVGKEFVEHAKKFDFPRVKQLSSAISIPIQLISAGKGMWFPKAKILFKTLNCEKEFKFLKKSGHSFEQEGEDVKLFLTTLKWFNRFK